MTHGDYGFPVLQHEGYHAALCGVRPDTQHSLRGIQEVPCVVEGVETNDIGTCHRLGEEERERESERKGGMLDLRVRRCNSTDASRGNTVRTVTVCIVQRHYLQ